jgi:hypothetical protein
MEGFTANTASVYINEPPKIAGSCDYCKFCDRTNFPRPVRVFQGRGYQLMPDGADLHYREELIVKSHEEAIRSHHDFRPVHLFAYSGELNFMRWQWVNGHFCSEHCRDRFVIRALKEGGLYDAPGRTV